MRPFIARANEQLDPLHQLANTPPPQSTTPDHHPVSIHQMAPPQKTSDCSLLLIYRPRKDERLSWPSWLTCSGRFTHITGHSSDARQAQDRKSSLAKNRRSTTVPRYQLHCYTYRSATYTFCFTFFAFCFLFDIYQTKLISVSFQTVNTY